MEIILAIFFGTLFGFALNRAGATNPQVIINMLRLTDTHLLRVMLLAVAVSSGLLFAGLASNLVDPGNLSVKTLYWGVPVGGILLGIGWALAGYCPGTGVAAMGEGRKDAFFFVLGGLVWAFAYTVMHAKFMDTFIMDKLLGGKVSLALTMNESFPALVTALPGVVIAGLIALILGIAAWKLPERI
jgi:uncharacterized membrane protein YedE/YeeE